jgi:hypothetical protein
MRPVFSRLETQRLLTERASAVAKSKRNDSADSPFQRVLALIEPPKEQQDECREDLEYLISEIANTVPRRSVAQSNQLAAVADSLRLTRRAIQKLSLFDQVLLLREPPFQRVFRGPDIKKRLAAFFHELDQSAAWADKWSKFHKVPPSDRRRDYQKLEAANSADWLFFQFSSKQPSLSPGSDFLELASVLYEAATGKADIDLRWQCRIVVEQKRK